MSICRRSNQRVNSMRWSSKAMSCSATLHMCTSIPKKLIHDGCLAPESYVAIIP